MAPSGADHALVSVVLAGCGRPLRSMGWYHCTQLLDLERNCCPLARLKFVVEPWYLSDAGRSSPGCQEFDAWRKEVEARHGVSFIGSFDEIPAPTSDEVRMGIVSGRTADSPSLLSGCIRAGCCSILLEKPGATTVAELEAMKQQADNANVRVFMGFNKNVSNYVADTRTLSRSTSGSKVTFLHHNTFEDTPEALGECFERNAEGMVKNMAIHELALLTTFYDVTVDNVAEVVADLDFSRCLTLAGPSGKEFTDFDKLKFLVRTKAGCEIGLEVSRCGVGKSAGIVESTSGEEIDRFWMPDEETLARAPELEKKVGPAVSYFFAQDPDYATLKDGVSRHCLGHQIPEGIPGIEVESRL